MIEGACSARQRIYPMDGVKQLPPCEGAGSPLDGEACFKLWRKYHMLENIQRHSMLVAQVAEYLALKACQAGMDMNPAEVRAAGLLHDIAKTWAIEHSCSHAALGASWVVADTKNYAVAQGVLLHVHWPWPLPEGRKICQLPLFVFYADKRVRHDKCVTLDERFEDLLERYGKTDSARTGIRLAWEQSENVEKAIAAQLDLDLAKMTWIL